MYVVASQEPCWLGVLQLVSERALGLWVSCAHNLVP
jgi:hypothetical protein